MVVRSRPRRHVLFLMANGDGFAPSTKHAVMLLCCNVLCCACISGFTLCAVVLLCCAVLCCAVLCLYIKRPHAVCCCAAVLCCACISGGLKSLVEELEQERLLLAIDVGNLRNQLTRAEADNHFLSGTMRHINQVTFF